MALKIRTTYVLAAAFVAAALAGCNKAGNMQQMQMQAGAAPQAVQVVVQQVELSDAIIRTEAPGRTSAYQVAAGKRHPSAAPL